MAEYGCKILLCLYATKASNEEVTSANALKKKQIGKNYHLEEECSYFWKNNLEWRNMNPGILDMRRYSNEMRDKE